MKSSRPLISNDTYRSFENACRNGHTDSVNQLLEKYGNTIAERRAIHNAVKGGHAGIMRKLLGLGININSLDVHGWTAVHYAAYYNHVNILAYLCESYPQEVQRRTHTGIFHGNETLLHVAARGAASETLKWIINKAFFDVDARDQNDDTALHWAIRKRAEKCALLLIANGAKLDALNKQSLPPLDCIDPKNESKFFREFKSALLLKINNPAALQNTLESDQSDYHDYCRIL